MKKNILTKLLALVLALIMVLGTFETAVAEITEQEYEKAVQIAAELFSQQVLNAELLDELNKMTADMSEEQFASFLQCLSESESQAVSQKVIELVQLQAELDADYYFPTVNFSRAAGFGAPVVGEAPVMRMMLLAAENEEADNGLELDKEVSIVNAETGEYKLTLEAWATGEKVITEVSETIPTDIILVLDQSGSMNFCMYGDCDNQYCDGASHGNVTYTYNKVYDISENGTYFVKPEGGNSYYQQVYYCEGYTSNYGSCSGGWFYFQHSSYGHIGNSITNKTSENGSGTQFYTRTANGQVYDKRSVALKSAVTSFVAAVNEKAAGNDKNLSTTADNVDHRIAIVGFASENSSSNTEILTVAGTNSGSSPNQVGVGYSSLNATHYASALQKVSTADGQAMVTKAINALGANGSTAVDYGMNMADSILANNPVAAGEKRNRVVIVFTDGSPTYDSSFSESVANNAIAKSNTIKNTRGATVYSIGIFGGADGSTPGTLPANNTTGSNRENRFMHLVSSNYPNATNMSTPGTLNSKLSSNESYYLSAGDTSTLTNIFKSIAKDIESGGSNVTLDKSTVVRDVLTEQFVLPEGTEVSDIKVYTSSVNTTTGAFETPVAFDDATVAISADGKTVSVTNFDFADNWVGTTTSSSATTYHGKKLIIEIPIVTRDGFLGGNGVLTNADGSGVYEDSSAEEAVEEFVSPKVNVAVDDVVVVTATDKNVYLNGSLTSDQLLEGSTYKCGDVVLDPAEDNFGLDSWQTAYVQVGEAATGTNASDFKNMTEDKTFTLTCTVTPNNTNPDTSLPGNVAETKSGSATANVNVFKPVLTFEDSVENYLADVFVDSITNVTGYHDAENYVSEAWVHTAEDGTKTTVSVTTGEDGTTTTTPTMVGTKPTLTIAYDTKEADITAEGIVEATEDIPVNVTVKIGDTPIDNYVTFEHVACTDLPDGVTCGYDASKCEFIVHVINVAGDLIINKTGLAEGESAIFTVTGYVPNGTATGEAKTWTVVLTGDAEGKATAKLTGLRVKSQFTVTEDPNWVWTYTVTPSSVSGEINSRTKETAMASFSNSKNEQWLYGEHSAVNAFDNK